MWRAREALGIRNQEQSEIIHLFSSTTFLLETMTEWWRMRGGRGRPGGGLDTGRAVKAEGENLRKLLAVKCHAEMQSYDFMKQSQETALAPALPLFMYNNPLV